MTIAELMNKVGFKVKDEDVKKVNGTFSDIKNTATKLLGAIGIGFSLTQINAMVEEFGRVNNQIKNSTKQLGDQHEIQQKILKSASDTRSSYESTAKVVSNLVHENSNLFGTIDEAIAFNNSATMLFKTAGKTNEEIAGLMEAINKSFAKGKVDSETINQLLERSPEAVELLCKQLGVSKEMLEELASSGKISLEDLKSAFVDNSEAIEKSFGKVKMTVSDALLVIRNKWGKWLSDMDETSGLTNTISQLMVKGFNGVMAILDKVKVGFEGLSKMVGGSQNALKLLAIIAGAIFLAFNFSKILTGMLSLIKMLGNIKLSTLAAFAVVVLIALLVEDFINFMQGNKSLIGEMFEKLGIDADDARQTIIDAWNAVVEFFEQVGETISDVYNTIKDAVSGFIEKVKEGIDWLREHETALGLVTIAVSTLTAAIIAYNIAQAIKNAGGIAELAQLALLQVQLWGLSIAEGAHTAASWLATTATTAFGAAMSFLTSPITLVILAVGALIAIVFLLVKNWDTVVGFFKGLWDKVVNIFKSVLAWIKKNVASIILFIINPFAGVFKYLYDNCEGFRNFINNVIEAIKSFFVGLWNKIVSVFSGVASWFAGVFQSAWDGIQNIWNAVVGWFQGVWDGIVGIFSVVGQWFYDQFIQAWNNIVSIFSGVTGFFQGIWDTIVGMFTEIGTSVGNAIGGAFKNVVNSIINFAENTINGFIKAINTAIELINAIPGVSIPKLQLLAIPRLAEGGYVEANKPRQVIIGDNKTEGEIVSPISKMRDTVLDALQLFASSLKPSPSSMQTLSKAANNYVITQNIEINNKFEGDRAGQQKSAAAMNKAANDCTAELARGLAYSR